MKTFFSTSIIMCLITIGCSSGNNTNSSGSNPPPAVLASIKITTASITVPLGATQPLTATGTYSDNSTQILTNQVTWASATTSVATISNAAGSLRSASSHTARGAGLTVRVISGIAHRNATKRIVRVQARRSVRSTAGSTAAATTTWVIR